MGQILRYSDFLKTYKTRGYRLNHLENWKKYFPIKASPILAGIVADLICDGHLQGDPIWRADFTSKSLEELKDFEFRLNKLFKLDCKIRKCTSNKFGETFNIGVNCAPIARILFLCGVPAGQKVLTKFSLPKWIKEDKECFREFCKRMFTCEGSIMHEKNRRFPQIRLDMWKWEGLFREGVAFIQDICTHLDRHFKIKTAISFSKSMNKRKDGLITRPVRVYIVGENSVLFYREIGFGNWKQQNLKGLLTDYL